MGMDMSLHKIQQLISKTLFGSNIIEDNKRVKVFDILKEHGFTVSQTEHTNFYKFIMESYNTMYYQKFIVLCCGLYTEEETFKILNKIINRYYKRNEIISFKELFEIDIEWYEFFKENADIDGNVYLNEERMGVD